jgi:hypothetical protein
MNIRDTFPNGFLPNAIPGGHGRSDADQVVNDLGVVGLGNHFYVLQMTLSHQSLLHQCKLFIL